ncbi:hypothetical protein SAMN04487995_2171 [Dyadobacter koreensis]|uniref:Uncharacterized protein n=1 Tax=Dyadobacter koreensis TaxID=408657 RepID=A0A1H6TCZ8_9BACT|nr:hypothetical protein SAMN04487995_2171 [Dyadobacter koreensis]
MQSIAAFTKMETDKCAIMRISGKKERVSSFSAYSFFLKLLFYLQDIFISYLE